eukprot:3681877-Alexandrium_andersonii.AAC.1
MSASTWTPEGATDVTQTSASLPFWGSVPRSQHDQVLILDTCGRGDEAPRWPTASLSVSVEEGKE